MATHPATAQDIEALQRPEQPDGGEDHTDDKACPSAHTTDCRPGGAPSGDVAHDGRVKLTLDLHDIYNRSADIDRALRAVMDEAVAKKAPLVEIIPGKGSGALKKRVLRFLDQKENRALYHRVEKDVDNHGRIFVHFRWKGPARRR